MPKVSVIIPIYNAEKYFEHCAVSLFEQTLDDIEYIFVDDCTPDNSIEILNNVINRYPERRSHIKIVTMKENSGQAIVRNTGIKHATGDYIIHCDSDDWVELDIYEKLYSKAIETNADIVVCDFYYENTYGVEIAHIEHIASPHECIKKQHNGSVMLSTWNRLIKRQLISDNNIHFIPKINYGEDLCFILKAYYYSKKIEYVSIPLYHYNRTNQNSIVNRTSETEFIEQMTKCYCHIDQFFTEKKFELNMAKVKINLRDRWLWHPNMVNLKKWRTTYPEVVSIIISDKSLKPIYRICYLLASKRFYIPLMTYMWISKLCKRFRE